MAPLRRFYMLSLQDAFITLALVETGIWVSCYISDSFYFVHDIMETIAGVRLKEGFWTPPSTICIVVNTMASLLRVIILTLLWYNVLGRIRLGFLQFWLYAGITIDSVVFIIDAGLGFANGDFWVIPQLLLFLLFRSFIYNSAHWMILDLGSGSEGGGPSNSNSGSSPEEAQGSTLPEKRISLFKDLGIKGIYDHYKEELRSCILVILTAEFISSTYLTVAMFLRTMIWHSSCFGVLPRHSSLLNELTHFVESIYFLIGLGFLLKEWRIPLRIWTYLCLLEFPIILFGVVLETSGILHVYNATHHLLGNILWVSLYYTETLGWTCLKIVLLYSLFKYMSSTAPGGRTRMTTSPSTTTMTSCSGSSRLRTPSPGPGNQPGPSSPPTLEVRRTHEIEL